MALDSRSVLGLASALALGLLCGCTTGGLDQVSAAAGAPALASGPVPPVEGDAEFGIEAETVQPRLAKYRCEDGGEITVENGVTAVKVLASDGVALDLPASPPESRSRYVQASYALVLDGEEALFMKAGKPPLTCRR
jgi:membrane-bound inhibitor of C-type lysozyme